MSGVSITPENILNAPSTPVTNATRQRYRADESPRIVFDTDRPSKPEHRTLDLETLSVHEDASDVDAASTVALRDASPDMAATAGTTFLYMLVPLRRPARSLTWPPLDVGL